MIGEHHYIGKEIGNYTIVNILARGGFGTVYKAQHKLLKERFVAIKFLHAYLGSQEEREKFLQEAEVLEKLRHSHILRIIDVGIDVANGDRPYIITDFAPNGTLRDRIKNTSLPLPSMEESLPILSQIAEALQEVHTNDIIHRDIKPSNVLFDAKGNVLLADFGIAKILDTTSGDHTAHMVGTPAYMAPEQFDGKVSKRCDLYALGCLAYELYTGQRPFTGDRDELEQKHKYALPKPPRVLNPSIPEHIEQAILRALAKSPTDRYSNVSEFVSALQVPSPPLPAMSTLSSETARDKKTKELMLANHTPGEEDNITPDRNDLHHALGKPTTHLSSPLIVPVPQPDPPSAHPTISITKPADGERMSNPAVTPINSSLWQLPVIPVSQSGRMAPSPTIKPVSLPGGGGNAGRSPRRYGGWQLLVIVLTSLLLFSLLLYGGIALAASGALGSLGNAVFHISPATSSTATATITPKSQDLSTSYALSGVTGTPDVTKRQVLVRPLTFTTQPASKTVNATSIESTQSIRATGTLTFFNGSSSPYGVAADTVFTDSQGVQVANDVVANIPAGNPNTGFGSVTVSAHTVNGGASGNIKALDFNKVQCCGSTAVSVSNNGAFSGGQDPQDSTAVQQSDINGAANPLIAQLRPTALSSLNALKHANEQFFNTSQCASRVTSDHNVGDRATNVTATVTVTCTGKVYDQSGPNGTQAIAANLLKSEAPSDITKNDPNANPADYALLNNQVVTAVTQTTFGRNGVLSLKVSAEGVWVYQFTPTKLRQLKALIAGKSSNTVRTFLLGQPGVSLVNGIVVSNNSSTLPTDVTQVTIVVKPVPGVQTTPTVTPGTPGGGLPTPVGTLTSPVATPAGTSGT